MGSGRRTAHSYNVSIAMHSYSVRLVAPSAPHARQTCFTLHHETNYTVRCIVKHEVILQRRHRLPSCPQVHTQSQGATWPCLQQALKQARLCNLKHTAGGRRAAGGVNEARCVGVRHRMRLDHSGGGTQACAQPGPAEWLGRRLMWPGMTAAHILSCSALVWRMSKPQPCTMEEPASVHGLGTSPKNDSLCSVDLNRLEEKGTQKCEPHSAEQFHAGNRHAAQSHSVLLEPVQADSLRSMWITVRFNLHT